MQAPESIRLDADRAPEAPGCYLFRNAEGKVLYVGKAKVLYKRVRNYLRPQADGRARIPEMVQRSQSVEYVVTKTEKEALILENNLIKLHKPKYNVSLRDDKTYHSLRMDMSHPFPRPTIVHKYKKDGATYFGPFVGGFKLRQALEALKREFPLRRCSDHVLRNRTRACVYADIGLCCAPCVDGRVSKEEYAKLVSGMIDVIKGRDTSIFTKLERQMQEAAGALDFERAAYLRDQVHALRATVEGQNAQMDGSKDIYRDVVGLHREGQHAQIHVLLYRDDKLVGSTTHAFHSSLPDDELVEQFVARYYEGDRATPPEVLLPLEVDDAESLGEYLSDKAGFAVRVVTPQRGPKRQMVELASLNAQHAMRDLESKQAQQEQMLNNLQSALELENLPRRMECFDVSHLQGTEIVASRVTFVDGAPDKNLYRRYKMQTVFDNDDFASMEETLRRRLERGLEEGDFPDLIVIDGGAAQLARVQKVFDELNIIGVDLVGLAKSRDKSGPAYTSNYSSSTAKRVTFERVFLSGREEPVVLDQKSPEMYLLMRLRDEAHRFAITFNRERRRKEALKSGLDAIPGVGPKRKRALIKHFGSPKQVGLASIEELCRVDGMTLPVATAIYEFYRKARSASNQAED